MFKAWDQCRPQKHVNMVRAKKAAGLWLELLHYDPGGERFSEGICSVAIILTVFKKPQSKNGHHCGEHWEASQVLFEQMRLIQSRLSCTFSSQGLKNSYRLSKTKYWVTAQKYLVGYITTFKEQT